MTENEIIQILKDNKRNGIAFGFLPDEVIQFASKHKENLKFHDIDGFWIETKYQHEEGYDISIHAIVCLPEDFELKKEAEGEWAEFEIREDGYFNSDIGLHLWFEWQRFLKFSYNHDIGFTAFGGWRYKNDDVWYMSPLIDSYNHNCHCYCNMYKDNEKNIIPSIPVKIRFWKKIIKG